MANFKRDIVLVSGSFWPREGGAERQMRAVLEEAVHSGLSVAVVTQAIDGKPRIESANGVDIFRVGSLSVFAKHPRAGMFLALISSSIVAISLRPSSVITLMLGSQSFAGAIAARVSRSRHVVRLTGGGNGPYRSEPVARHARPASRLFTKAILKTKPIIVSPAQHLIDDLQELFTVPDDRVLIIRNGVVPVTPSRPKARSGVLWYARANDNNSDEVFRQVVEKMPEVTFRVIGRELLDLPDNVNCLGWVQEPQTVMTSVDVVLNTSRYEGSPNTVLQALAAGATVVGFDNPGMREMRDRFPGWVQVVPFAEPQAMARAVREAPPRPSEAPKVPTLEDAQIRWIQLLEGQRFND